MILLKHNGLALVFSTTKMLVRHKIPEKKKLSTTYLKPFSAIFLPQSFLNTLVRMDIA